MQARSIVSAVLLALAPLLTGCVFAIGIPYDEDHPRIHRMEASADRDDDRRHASGRPEPGVLAGRVVDAEGRPTKARVAAVKPRGSWSMSTEGSFEFTDLPTGDYVVTATTEDGRIGLASGLSVGHRTGVAGLTLRLEPGAVLRISYEGPQESLRCAVFHDGLRVEDHTLRRGEPSRVVVPPGRIPIQLYTGDSVLAVREVRVEAGDEEEVEYRVAPNPPRTSLGR